MYKKKSHIHFVGIGGIGMSGIATILKENGYIVSGCDPDTTQDTIAPLKDIGCHVYHGNNSAQCNDTTIDILVYIPMYATTIPAITNEITRAQTRGIPTISRACMLAELMRSKYSIAITGSHGKTTTTSLISHILIEAQKDPTIVVGGQLKNLGTNARAGKGDFLVAEADESDKSFLELYPCLAVITNIDLEHLETYKDLDDIKSTFTQFLNNLPFYGKAIICIDDTNIRSLLPLKNIPSISYGIEYQADFSAKNIILNSDHSLFTLYKKGYFQQLGTVTLPLAGKHNIYNALGAIAVAQELDIDFATIVHSLASFRGIERRFSFHGTYKGAEIFDDYGHHPQEIEHTLTVARKRARNKLTVVFQPHRYTRTEKLWSDFLTVFSSHAIDTFIITDIYSAGEYPIATITSHRFAQELALLHPSLTVHYVPFEESFNQIKRTIAAITTPDDLILFLGAGKTHLIAHEMAQ